MQHGVLLVIAVISCAFMITILVQSTSADILAVFISTLPFFILVLVCHAFLSGGFEIARRFVYFIAILEIIVLIVNLARSIVH